MSNTIYSQKNTSKKFHYTYQITELSTNRKYIGVRSSNILPEKDLGIKYFSSSSNKDFIKNQKENHSNYKYEVLNIFSSREDSNNHEIELHEKYDVASNNEFYNMYNSNASGFIPVDKIVTKDKDGNIYWISVNDPRYTSGELVAYSKGLIPIVNIHTGESYTVTKDNIDYINGILVHITKGKIVVEDKAGNTMQVDQNDPRYLSGELVSIHKGKVTVKDKYGNTLRVDVNDPRYLSGELVHIDKNMTTVKDEEDNVMKVSINDPRYLSGELVGITKGLLTVKDEDGNKIQLTSEEYKNQNDIKIHTSGKAVVVDKFGNTLSVDVNDPRYLSGELVGIAKGKSAVKDIHGNRSMIYTNDERFNVSLFPCSAKLFKIYDEIFTSTMASKKYNISKYKVESRARSDKYPHWNFI